MVIFVVPVFFNCSVWETVVPRGTLPKFTLPGVMVSASLVPAPVTPTYAKLLVALLANAICPLNVPVISGVNFTVRVRCAPGDSVRGSAKPLRLYMLGCKLSLLKAMLAFPVLVMVTVVLLVLPTWTFPKFTAEGKKDRIPVPAALFGIVAERQVRNAKASRLANRRRRVWARCEYLGKKFC